MGRFLLDSRNGPGVLGAAAAAASRIWVVIGSTAVAIVLFVLYMQCRFNTVSHTARPQRLHTIESKEEDQA